MENQRFFFSVQGEGPSLGIPSIFVRFSLCNLHCRWCDSDYTWNWRGTRFLHDRDDEEDYDKYVKNEQIVELGVEEAVSIIQKLKGTNVVLTGGEPMLHQTDAIELMKKLFQINSAYRFEVETNGTIGPEPELEELVQQFNVSPKLSNSGVPAKLRWKEEVIKRFARNSKANFKFVIDQLKDIEEVDACVRKYSIAPARVILMPQGVSSDQLKSHAAAIVEVCKQRGYRFSDRLHIHIFGSQRGV